ncbi:MAG: ATPase, partial [Sphingomonas sp.]
MPQLSQIAEIYASQLFWLVIVFGLIYFGIGKAMVPKIERTIDDRNARITGDLAAATTARDAARASEEAYQTGLDTARSQAAQTFGAAKARATAAAETKMKAGDAAAADRLHAATTGIAASKGQALAEIEAATVDAVEAIVAKLSGVAPDRAVVEQK